MGLGYLASELFPLEGWSEEVVSLMEDCEGRRPEYCGWMGWMGLTRLFPKSGVCIDRRILYTNLIIYGIIYK